MKAKDRCPRCNGSGNINCPRCGGRGFEPDGSTCRGGCGGSGTQNCPSCGGSGVQ